MKKLQLNPNDYVKLEHIIVYTGKDDNTPPKNEPRTITINARLVSSKNDLVDNHQEELKEDEICIDQTYREALGLKIDDKICIKGPSKKFGFGESILSKMNFQKSVVRVQANASYMERQIPIACLCEEMITSIGAVYGDRIIIESHKTNIIAKCAPLTPLMQKFHDYVSQPTLNDKERKDLGNETKGYFDDPKEWGLQSKMLLDHGDIIHPIFMDEIGRKLLGGITRLHPVKIRRSFSWEFRKKLNSFGAISLVALSVTLFFLVEHPDNPFLWFWTVLLGAWGAWSVLTSSTYKTSVSE